MSSAPVARGAVLRERRAAARLVPLHDREVALPAREQRRERAQSDARAAEHEQSGIRGVVAAKREPLVEPKDRTNAPSSMRDRILPGGGVSGTRSLRVVVSELISMSSCWLRASKMKRALASPREPLCGSRRRRTSAGQQLVPRS